MGHATELATTVGSAIVDPNNANPEVTIAGLSRKAGLQDRALGRHLYATSSQYVKRKLIMDSSRYGPNGPSAIKIYHYLAYKLHMSTQKAGTKLTEAMSDASSAGRCQPVKKPGQLEAEVKALDQAADKIRITTGGFDAEAAGVWRSALDRLISSLESSTEYFAEFGLHIMTFTGNQLREAIDEPMGVLATNYRRQKTEPRQETGGTQHHGTDGITAMGQRWLHIRLTTCVLSSENLENVPVGTSASSSTKAGQETHAPTVST
jgi:hypothetical protein